MANQNSKNKTNTKKQNSQNKNNTNGKKVSAKKTNTNSKKIVPKEKVKKENVESKKNTKVEVKETTVLPEKTLVVKEETKKEKKSFELTSKQKDIILILLVVVLLVVALIVTSIKSPKLDVELPLALEGEPGFTEIAYKDYETKLSEEKAFLVVIVKDGCGYCEAYEPILKEVSTEYNVPINYINLSNLTQDEYNSLSKSNSYLRTKKWGTPTTLLLYGNAVVDSISGYVEKEELVSFIKENIKVDSNEQ